MNYNRVSYPGHISELIHHTITSNTVDKMSLYTRAHTRVNYYIMLVIY